MAELWYYTNEGKQMDAVAMKELKRLVGDGPLKPTDMVWKEGMPRWTRASSLKEVFPDPGGGDKKPGGDIVDNKKDAQQDGGNPPPGQEIKGEVRYVAALQPGKSDSRTFKFKKGVNYELRVRSEPRVNPKHPDIDLFIF